jgi:hypothetical protein
VGILFLEEAGGNIFHITTGINTHNFEFFNPNCKKHSKMRKGLEKLMI